jgi:hypothetical protein
MFKLFLVTLLFTIVLFIGAALVFNFSKRRTARGRNLPSASCQNNGGSMCCSCTSTLQTTIRKR